LDKSRQRSAAIVEEHDSGLVGADGGSSDEAAGLEIRDEQALE